MMVMIIWGYGGKWGFFIVLIWTCICVCYCVSVCAYVCVFVYVVCVCLCVFVCQCVYVSIYLSLCECLRLYTCVYMCVCVWDCVCSVYMLTSPQSSITHNHNDLITYNPIRLSIPTPLPPYPVSDQMINLTLITSGLMCMITTKIEIIRT